MQSTLYILLYKFVLRIDFIYKFYCVDRIVQIELGKIKFQLAQFLIRLRYANNVITLKKKIDYPNLLGNKATMCFICKQKMRYNKNQHFYKRFLYKISLRNKNRWQDHYVYSKKIYIYFL